MINKEKLEKMIKDGILTFEEASELEALQQSAQKQTNSKDLPDPKDLSEYSTDPAPGKRSSLTGRPWTDAQINFQDKINAAIEGLGPDEEPVKQTHQKTEDKPSEESQNDKILKQMQKVKDSAHRKLESGEITQEEADGIFASVRETELSILKLSIQETQQVSQKKDEKTDENLSSFERKIQSALSGFD